jgi:DNA-binding CsgD family transcriptional regulator
LTQSHYPKLPGKELVGEAAAPLAHSWRAVMEPAALAIFDDLGAAAWAEHARTELARVGRRPRAPDELTETERRVAELAATGLSSRQIAERAFLAPKTVGNVMGRVYQKLGIHSRAELGAAMSPGRAVVLPGLGAGNDHEPGEPRGD